MKTKDIANRILGGIGQAVAADILWAVCSLPIFTAGAASAALYHCTVESVRKGAGNVLTDFFRVFKESFWRSLPVAMIEAVWFAALAFIAVNVKNTPEYMPNDIYTGVFIGLAILGSWLLPYVFAVMAEKRYGCLNAVKYAFYLSVKKIYFTLPLILLLWLAVAACISRSVLLLFIPAAYALAVSFILEPEIHNDDA